MDSLFPLTRSIYLRVSETSNDSVQGPPGSRIERVKRAISITSITKGKLVFVPVFSRIYTNVCSLMEMQIIVSLIHVSDMT